MGHLLATVNPEAAARIGTEEDGQNAPPTAPAQAMMNAAMSGNDPMPVDLPEIGEPIRYHLRTGDFRAQRNVFPAQVTAVNPEKGTIDLIAFFDAEDRIDQRNALPWDGSGPGWERIPARVVMSNIVQEKAEMLSPEPPIDYSEQIVDLTVAIEKLDKRLSKLEKASKK